MSLPKYTIEDINRIYEERVQTNFRIGHLKSGVICEFLFIFPNGNKSIDIVHAFPINEQNNDVNQAQLICVRKIKEKLWDICGKYTLATGHKL